MPIDWSATRTPNFFEQYQQSFEAGRQLARQRAQEAREDKGLLASESDAAKKDEEESDPWEKLRGVEGHERDTAHGHAEVLSHLLTAIREMSQMPAERLAAARHAAAHFPQFGIDPNSITEEQVTDAALAKEISALDRFRSAKAEPQALGWPD